MLKWMGKEEHAWMFNHALHNGMLYGWTTNWEIKPLHKDGDVNNINNYRTNINGSLMAKLFGCILESNVRGLMVN